MFAEQALVTELTDRIGEMWIGNKFTGLAEISGNYRNHVPDHVPDDSDFYMMVWDGMPYRMVIFALSEGACPNKGCASHRYGENSDVVTHGYYRPGQGGDEDIVVAAA